MNIINHHAKLECPVCYYFKTTRLPRFANSRSLMGHIGKAHSISTKDNDENGKIPYKTIRDIKRLARYFEKSNHESFLKWIQSRGYFK